MTLKLLYSIVIYSQVLRRGVAGPLFGHFFNTKCHIRFTTYTTLSFLHQNWTCLISTEINELGKYSGEGIGMKSWEFREWNNNRCYHIPISISSPQKTCAIRSCILLGLIVTHSTGGPNFIDILQIWLQMDACDWLVPITLPAVILRCFINFHIFGSDIGFLDSTVKGDKDDINPFLSTQGSFICFL